MRAPVLAAVLFLVAAPAAWAAPTCVDRAGATIRCGTAGAMPVGWRPSPEAERARAAALPDGPSAGELLALACVLGGLFALIALMPEFDGWDRD